MGDDDVIVPTSQPLIEVSSAVAVFYKQLGFPPARQRALEDKHQGDLDAVLAELRSLTTVPAAAAASGDFSPGEVGSTTEASGDDELEDLFQ